MKLHYITRLLLKTFSISVVKLRKNGGLACDKTGVEFLAIIFSPSKLGL